MNTPATENFAEYWHQLFFSPDNPTAAQKNKLTELRNALTLTGGSINTSYRWIMDLQTAPENK